jgi:nanoRNase/pAp phosphatase (c-di-AMP/oligoRNAs hydrolase)
MKGDIMRLLTRSDFDGLGCAAILKEIGVIDDIKFVHPKDIQDGLVAVTSDDILTNIPYVKGCGLWFDHHSSEHERMDFGDFKGLSDASAKSAARVVYEYYGGMSRFNNSHLDDLVSAVDKADSADFTIDEILNPTGWVLLSFVMDPRTGLGRYKDYKISNYALMMEMIEFCRTKSIQEILDVSDVMERTTRYFEQDALFRDMIKRNTTIRKNIIVVDLRNEAEIYTGNRFVLYSLYPSQNISIQVLWGLGKQNIVLTCGHSIVNRTSKTDVGSLMLKYGGGGHRQVGTCQVPVDDATKILEEITDRMNADG